ncbi:MAG: hypothetical protein WCD86_04285, partial [Ktedonobacteraceae bacterium]
TSGSTTTLTVYAFGLEEYQYSGTGTLQNATYYYSLGGRLVGETDGPDHDDHHHHPDRCLRQRHGGLQQRRWGGDAQRQPGSTVPTATCCTAPTARWEPPKATPASTATRSPDLTITSRGTMIRWLASSCRRTRRRATRRG